jgi:hypothetical protein
VIFLVGCGIALDHFLVGGRLYGNCLLPVQQLASALRVPSIESERELAGPERRMGGGIPTLVSAI